MIYFADNIGSPLEPEEEGSHWNGCLQWIDNRIPRRACSLLELDGFPGKKPTVPDDGVHKQAKKEVGTNIEQGLHAYPEM